MFTLMVIAAACALLAGGLVKVVLDRTDSDYRITRVEMTVGSVLCLLFVVPLVTAAGYHLAKQAKMQYHEFWNGIETAAVIDTTQCTRDGSCAHEYACDWYWDTETYWVSESYVGSDGKMHSRSVMKTRQVHKHHDCPYVTEELTYVVKTTLSDKVIASHWFPANPQAHRYRAGVGLPNVPSGIPTEWTAAKDRIAASKPAGVTERHDYDNYILASQETILKKYSQAISRYTKAHLLPAVAQPTGQLDANKVAFVGPVPTGTNAADWQLVLSRLNGALGMQLRGDLHVVVVTSPKVTDPDEYSQALNAYWQSPKFGKDALSKNGIVLVVGSADGSTVAWSRAFTGMPVGNEALMTDLANLQGTPLTPDALLGAPTVPNPAADHPAFVHSTGKVDAALWGPNKFDRVSMSGDNGRSVGFTYLVSQIEPSGGAKFAIVLVAFLLCLLAWAGFAGYTSSAAVDAARHGRDPFDPTEALAQFKKRLRRAGHQL